MKFKQREIVLVPFPYTDLSNSKKRPALVLSNDNYNDGFEDVVVCAITSNKNHLDQYSTTLDDKDMELNNLPKPSVIKAHRVFSISQSRIIRRFGIVGKEKFQEVELLVSELLTNKEQPFS